MNGPGIAAYLVLSIVLFATGAFGVLIRRSPLIVLLALEIMLNAGNLALLAFEITSVVLLVAAVGGVILGSHSRAEDNDARA